MQPWMETALVFLLALAAAWSAGYLLYRLALRALEHRDEFWRRLVRRARAPVQLGLMVMAVSFAANIAPLPVSEGNVLRHALLIAFIVCVTWIVTIMLDIWMTLHLRRFRLDVEDNLLARKHVTQTRVLQRVLIIVVIAIGISAALMTFDRVWQYGVSLLASAGAAGIVLGLALQPVLRNLLAGIQLALTQPIRLDDAVIVEGEWGNVEEITATYVVIRIWDKRRLIVPLNYFMEQPFQNWTRNDATLIGTVLIYLDYGVSVSALRAEAERIVRASPLWNRDVFVLQVTDFREREVEVRILASATHAGKAFDLRCEIREKLLDYLQREQQSALPQTRASITNRAASALN
ncbi:mechanosensitive ion channel family protein [Paracoccus aestuariivivens]|uniref:Mechanosensitive ion channel n=1 Tax=Paracoccus aestuariivivens TaxID=1820333 RepID=A0A6L6JHA2_9RHOB|nr:mechanosensitive ion channel domain-containing protein [Paracoccus aestuariivivens]MTH79261.1 mechanosensitive ion channel [Paracoccus aestuariivivens]